MLHVTASWSGWAPARLCDSITGWELLLQSVTLLSLGCRLLARVSHEQGIYYQEMYCVCVWILFAILLKDKSQRRKI
jgi:hypothetical protein